MSSRTTSRPPDMAVSHTGDRLERGHHQRPGLACLDHRRDVRLHSDQALDLLPVVLVQPLHGSGVGGRTGRPAPLRGFSVAAHHALGLPRARVVVLVSHRLCLSGMRQGSPEIGARPPRQRAPNACHGRPRALAGHGPTAARSSAVVRSRSGNVATSAQEAGAPAGSLRGAARPIGVERVAQPPRNGRAASRSAAIATDGIGTRALSCAMDASRTSSWAACSAVRSW